VHSGNKKGGLVNRLLNVYIVVGYTSTTLHPLGIPFAPALFHPIQWNYQDHPVLQDSGQLLLFGMDGVVYCRKPNSKSSIRLLS
jgi:hypothetical protein